MSWKVELSGGKIAELVFGRDVGIVGGKVLRYETHAYLIVQNPPFAAFYCSGTVKLHYKDNPCKDRGRKEALKKALQKAGCALTKGDRTLIWKRYLSETKRPKRG